ncbi:MAG: TetR/AcrR family transcriptional regulator [Clostridium sp.]
MELKEMIMDATLDEFNEKSLKFTMDDVAKRLQISKKTIYTVFPDKETLFLETVDYCFVAIKEEERRILEIKDLDIVEKIKKILIVLPERQKSIDWRQIHTTKEKFPKIFEKIEKRIETEWDSTIELLQEGIRIGRLKPISIPVFKIIVENFKG